MRAGCLGAYPSEGKNPETRKIVFIFVLDVAISGLPTSLDDRRNVGRVSGARESVVLEPWWRAIGSWRLLMAEIRDLRRR
jgi:hypothetical protein